MKKSEIKLTGLQFKSIEKLRLVCRLLDRIEKEFGIREVYITLDDCFICPDIDIELLDEKIPMESLVKGIIIKIKKISERKK